MVEAADGRKRKYCLVQKSKMSMNSHEQNGRPPSLPPVRFTGPADPRTRNLPSNNKPVEVCRNYVWGICNKHINCKYRHDCTIEEMKSIINFCHNYQNRTGCVLPNCTYLHTSKEEENLFRTAGQLPRVLQERHAAMNAAAAAAASGNLSVMDGRPPMYFSQPPPPPPPLSNTGPPFPPLPLPIEAVLMPPPPPPPPTESSAIPSSSNIYSAPPPSINLPGVIANPMQPPITLYDTSIPPPSMLNGSLKRSSTNDVAAQPLKMRKKEHEEVADSMCEKCVQRELSIKLCDEEFLKISRENEYKKILLKSKVEEADNLKKIMRILQPADSPIEKYLELPIELMMQRVLDDRLSSPSTIIESIRSSSMRELIINYLIKSSSTESNDILTTSSTNSLLLPNDIVTTNITRSTTSCVHPSDMLTTDITRSSSSCLHTSGNGFSRLINGQITENALAGPSSSQTRSMYSVTPSRSSRSIPEEVQTPHAYPAPPFTPYQPTVPPPMFPPYQPAVPPPNVQPCFPPPPMGPSSANSSSSIRPAHPQPGAPQVQANGFFMSNQTPNYYPTYQ